MSLQAERDCLARDAHAEALDRVVAEALARANMSSVAEVDAIGVTVGPGLEICLGEASPRAPTLWLGHLAPPRVGRQGPSAVELAWQHRLSLAAAA